MQKLTHQIHIVHERATGVCTCRQKGNCPFYRPGSRCRYGRNSLGVSPQRWRIASAP